MPPPTRSLPYATAVRLRCMGQGRRCLRKNRCREVRITFGMLRTIEPLLSQSSPHIVGPKYEYYHFKVYNFNTILQMEHSTSALNERVRRITQLAKLRVNHPSVVLTLFGVHLSRKPGLDLCCDLLQHLQGVPHIRTYLVHRFCSSHHSSNSLSYEM